MDDYTKSLIVDKLNKFIEHLSEDEFRVIDNEAIKGLQEKAILKNIQADLRECRELIQELS